MATASFFTTSGKNFLIVAEKPSISKRIAGVLSSSLKAGKPKYKKGKSKYNPVYTINANSNVITITSVTGFLFNLDFDAPFGRKNKWKLEGLEGMIDADTHWELAGKRSFKENNKRIISQIKELAKTADFFISATDNDFAGELIGYQAYEVAFEQNQHIQSARMIFSSISYSDIVNAWKDIRDMRVHHKDAELTRQKTDLMTGAMFTRFLSLLVQEKTPGIMISWGGCQTLFLKHIKDKYDDHINFQSQPFWEISAILEKNGKQYEIKWDQGRQFDKTIAEACFSELQNEKQATVKEVEKTEWKKYPPVPLRTATMLQSLSRIMNISPKSIMEVAEALYNKGYISYPRTENEVHPPSFNANGVIEKFEDHPVYSAYAKELLKDGKRIRPRRGKHKTEDHDPIYPTKSGTQAEVETAVNKKHKAHAWRVYDFVTRHFLATCSKEALFHKTTITFQISTKLFEIDGKIKITDGFMKIYPFYRPKVAEVPDCEKGDVLNVVEVNMREGHTEPPKLADEAEIIKWASENSIGTDATFHLHLETVQKRRYVEKSDGKLVPTKLGISLCNALEQYAPVMIDVELRHSLQEKMDEISEGKIAVDAVINEFKKFARTSYKQLTEKSQQVSESLSAVLLEDYGSGQEMGICGTCGAMLKLESEHKYGNKISRYAVCEGCDTKLVLPKTGKIIPLVEDKCQICYFSVLKVRNYVICPNCFTNKLEKGLYYCKNCREKCKFSGLEMSSIPEADITRKPAGKCPKCDGELEALFMKDKAIVECSSCKFFARLPRPFKGKTSVAQEKCTCGTSLFSYRKKDSFL